MMQLFKLVWHSDGEFPETESWTHHPSIEMACHYAGKLLQSEQNRQFHTVEVWGPWPDLQEEFDGEPRIIELVTTRGVKEKES